MKMRRNRLKGVRLFLTATVLALALSVSAATVSFAAGGGGDLEASDAPINLQVPPMAYDQNKIVLEWEKWEGYWDYQLSGTLTNVADPETSDRRITDYEVYKDGGSAGFSSRNFMENYLYLAAWEHAAENTFTAGSHKVTHLSFTATGLSPDTEYAFKVRAKYADGTYSAFSEEIKARTAKPFTAVVEVNAETPDIIRVNNAANNISGTQNSSIYRRPNAGEEYGEPVPGRAYPETYTTTGFNNTDSLTEVAKIKASTAAIQKAIDSTPFGGKTVLKGTGDNANPVYYVTGAIFLHSYMTLEIEAGAVLLGSPVIDHYDRSLLVYPYSQDIRTQGLISAVTFDYGSLKNIRVTGGGIVDGNGAHWATSNGQQTSNTANDVTLADMQAVYTALGKEGTPVDPTNGAGVGQFKLPRFSGTGDSNTNLYGPGILSQDALTKGKNDGAPSPNNTYNTRPQLAIFRGVDGLCLDGLTWANPSYHGIVNYQSENITSVGTAVMTWDNHNGDGIEFGDSRGIHLLNNFYDTGDDEVNFAAGQGSVVRNTSDRVATGEAHIFNNYGRNGHGGLIAAGSHTSGWIGDMLAEENWASPSETAMVGLLRMKSGGTTGGGVRNITYRDTAAHYSLNMSSARGLVIADRNYKDANASTAYGPESEVPTVYENINLRNVTVTAQVSCTVNLLAQTTTVYGVDAYKMVARNFSFDHIRVGGNLTTEFNIADVSNFSVKNVTRMSGTGAITFTANNYGSRNVTIQNVPRATVPNVAVGTDRTPADLNWGQGETLAASASGNNVTLTWPAVANASGGYTVLVKETSGASRYFVERAKTATGVTTWTGPLSANETYDIQIVARTAEATGQSNPWRYYSDVSTEPLTGSVTTAARSVEDSGAPTVAASSSLGNVLRVGVSWQGLDFANNAVGGSSSGIQYYKIIATRTTEEDGGGSVIDTQEYRVYYDSYYAPDFPLYHSLRKGYSLSGLHDESHYTITMGVVTWTGEEYMSIGYTPMQFTTVPETLMAIPEWRQGAALTSTLDGNSKGVTLSWSAGDVSDPSRGDNINKFAGYRIYIDGVPMQATRNIPGVSIPEIGNHVNAVPNTTGTSIHLDFAALGLSAGRHTFAVEAGVEIIQYAGDSKNGGGESQSKSFLGTENKSVLRNNITMGKWTGTGPSVEITVTSAGEGGILSGIGQTGFDQTGLTMYAGHNLSEYEAALKAKLTVHEVLTGGSGSIAGDAFASHEYTLSGDISTAGTKSITITANGMQTSFDVSVTAVQILSASAVFDQSGLTVYRGDNLATHTDAIKARLTVNGTYNDGVPRVLAAGDYALSGDISTVGSKTITVTVNDTVITDEFELTVSEPDIASIEIEPAFVQGSIKVYTSDTTDALLKARLASALTVKATYLNATTGTISSANYSLSISGTTVTVTVAGQETTFQVVLTEVALTGIEVQFAAQGDLIVKAGDDLSDYFTALQAKLTVTGSYNDGTNAALAPANYTISGNIAAAGNSVALTVTANGSSFTGGFNVKVIAYVTLTFAGDGAPATGNTWSGDAALFTQTLLNYSAIPEGKILDKWTVGAEGGAAQDFTAGNNMANYINGLTASGAFTVTRLVKNEFDEISATVTFAGDGVSSPAEWVGDPAAFGLDDIASYTAPDGKVFDKWTVAKNGGAAQDFTNDALLVNYINELSDGDALTVTRVWKDAEQQQGEVTPGGCAGCNSTAAAFISLGIMLGAALLAFAVKKKP
ncbi:MAG: hypothetical protein LBL66_11285 [Clostridiales bacterium]|nr:hypothetical protein [Clostridiales bacterium]